MMQKNSKIYVAGHTGLVGRAIVRQLKIKGYSNLIIRTHQELDLTDNIAVRKFFEEERPDCVFLAAAKVGGIVANNTYRAEFLFENLMIQTNVIHYSYLTGVKKLLFLGSTCIYPKDSPQPIKESSLLTSPLEYTNEPYAIAKIAGMKMCESYNLQYGTNFISAMPTNLYGRGDNYNLETSHVLPALLRKIHLGKALEDNDWDLVRRDLNKRPIAGVTGDSEKEEILGILFQYGVTLKEDVEHSKKVFVEIWGSGKPLREFMWSEDMADACVFLMKHIEFQDIVDQMLNAEQVEAKEIRNTHINIGTGEDVSIKDLANLIKDIVGFKGELFFNTSRPEGTYRKVTDSSNLHKLGWKPATGLKEGIEEMYRELTGAVEVPVMSRTKTSF